MIHKILNDQVLQSTIFFTELIVLESSIMV